MMKYKFRGKRVGSLKWVYGDLITTEGEIVGIMPDPVCGKAMCFDESFGNMVVEVIPETVGMWTGIKDSKGVDIYDGCTMVFADKAEWYHVDIFKARLGGDTKVCQEVMTDHVKYPYEKRVVELPGDYEWLLSEEIQRFWIVEDVSKPVTYSQETEG
jgi:hypothetical protein